MDVVHGYYGSHWLKFPKFAFFVPHLQVYSAISCAVPLSKPSLNWKPNILTMHYVLLRPSRNMPTFGITLGFFLSVNCHAFCVAFRMFINSHCCLHPQTAMHFVCHSCVVCSSPPRFLVLSSPRFLVSVLMSKFCFLTHPSVVLKVPGRPTQFLTLLSSPVLPHLVHRVPDSYATFDTLIPGMVRHHFSHSHFHVCPGFSSAPSLCSASSVFLLCPWLIPYISIMSFCYFWCIPMLFCCLCI